MLSGKSNTTGKNIDQIALLIGSALLLLISFFYFFRFSNGLFFLQEKKLLFIFSQEYLHDFVVKAGGLLVYAGNFFTQGYFNLAYASVINTLSVLLFLVIFIRIIRLLSADDSFLLPLIIFPSCLIFIMQAQEDHFLHHSIGYLLTGAFYLATIVSDKRRVSYLIPILFPFFFYLTGSFALLFLLIYLVHSLSFSKGIKKYLSPLLLIFIASVTFFIFAEKLFLQLPDQILSYPLNFFQTGEMAGINIILAVYMVSLPIILRIKGRLKIKKESIKMIPRLSPIIIFIATLYILAVRYDPARNIDHRIEGLFFEQNWDALIALQEKTSSKNEISQYYYNVALSEKGQLCDRMFNAPQDFGINSLALPLTIVNINRSVYFYYAIGLINQANHLAYESFVLDGPCPETLKMLIKTDIINGNYKIAERNINLLKRTLHYRRWADKFEKMLYHPEIVVSDPELGEKIKLMPQKDFFIGADVKDNIDMMLLSNPDNKKAFEYKMAFLLLEKKFTEVMYQVKKMNDMKYTRLPIHIEESMMIFINRKYELPYLGDFKVSDKTENRYNSFLSDLRTGKGESKPKQERSMKSSWGNTYWYYFEFN